ncbi:restriction endonuclease subunit S [Clostridium aquiflavi]|uniref:Restriction endonuclease subunit S n=1 Tax=Clostridium aquiflavi TaxID=3073603 RepID=A0ABU1EDF6_9CLOT|nr:restriction endonuclease subunit S [Clostridium sp. 5N-1]MDR5586398.1 restriction endonuclease subunit S [Clostridium sp. 5N-1]
MAKKKITLEEKMEEAIVTDVPYEVPGNWVCSKLGSLLKNMTTKKPDDRNEFFKYIDIDAIDNKNQRIAEPKVVNVKEAPSRASREVMEGDVLFSTVRPYLKNIAIVTNEYKDCIASTGFYICRSKGALINKYLYYLLCSEGSINYFTSMMKGDNSPSIRKEEFERLNVPLPPLKEQQRIVDRIESLFEKLDKAKELIEEAREGFEKRKSAILEKAFRGGVTEKWRKKRKINEMGKLTSLKEVADFKGGFAFKSNQFVDEGIQVIRMGNLYNGVLDLTRNPVYISRNIDSNLISKYSIKSGDILLTLTGTKYKRDYGYAVLIEEDKELLLNQRILSISPKRDICTSYLYYYLKSEFFRDIFFSQETGGVNQGNVSGKFVESVKINIVSLEEQKEIVRILDKLLEDESKIEQLTQLEDQIELIKKSILAKAFRGELGTNDSNEESALELLKEILSKE